MLSDVYSEKSAAVVQVYEITEPRCEFRALKPGPMRRSALAAISSHISQERMFLVMNTNEYEPNFSTGPDERNITEPNEGTHAQSENDTPQHEYTQQTPSYVYPPAYTAPQQKPSSGHKTGKRIAFAVTSVFVCAAFFVCGTLLGNGWLGTSTPSSDTSSTGTAGIDASGNVSEYHFETVSSDEAYSVSSIAAMTMDSVVEITTETVSSGGFMQQYVVEGAGSGVIVREDGLIVTNHHVIDGASTITVRLRSGEEYAATLIGTDSNSDIALLSIDATGLKAATIGDSSTLAVGDLVVAIGNPLGSLGGTVTDGIISALERQITIDGQSMTLLQTNAAINPGNSGGGLFNAAGELIGIVNAKSSGEDIEGLGFAIPINTATSVMEDLLNYGYVRGRVMLGVSLIDIYSDSYVHYYGVPSQGTYISSVSEGSDAEKAGLKSGDMIKTVNGVAVTSADVVSDILNDSSVGDTLTLVIQRVVSSGDRFGTYETEELTITVTLSEYTPGTSLLTSGN